MCEAINQWHRRKSRLNHDWLQNKMLPKVGKWVQVEKGEVIDEGFTKRAVQELASDWQIARRELRELADSFRIVASPAACVAEEPLCRLPDVDRDWLFPVVDAVWERREKPMNLLAVLSDAVGGVEKAMAATQDSSSPEGSHGLVAALALQDALRRLAKSLSSSAGVATYSNA